MKKENKVVIIGAGIGGIATSIYLARQGFSVSVFEKNASPGGRCSQVIRDGHRFDMGATLFLMPAIYRRVLKSLGLTLEECFETKPITSVYTLHFGDGTALSFSTDKSVLKEQLEKIEKGSFEKSQKLLKKGYEFFLLATENLLGRNFYRLFDFITLRNALMLVKLKTYTRHMRFIRKYFKNPNLQKAFTFQNIYVGQNPYTAPALFAMLPAAELTEGTLFPVGGMFSITRKLLSLAEETGVIINCNSPVKGIQTERNQVSGIVLEDGSFISAGLVVANADLPYVYRDLLPKTAKSRHIGRLRHSCSAIVFHWGMDKIFPGLSHHSVFLSGDYKENLDKIFNEHSLSPDPSFYVHAPVRSDPTAAPGGQDTLSVIVPCGYIDGDGQNWNDLKNTARASVIERLKKEGLGNIEEHIKFEMCYLPQTWKNVFNLSKGATFGSLGHNIFQMGYFRPHNRHDHYKNLYFTGGSTHPGSGIPLVLLSAMLTSERIIKETAV